MGYLDEPLLPDPVIEEYKKHVDMTLIDENLKLTHEQRLQKFFDFMESLEAMREAGRKAREKK